MLESKSIAAAYSWRLAETESMLNAVNGNWLIDMYYCCILPQVLTEFSRRQSAWHSGSALLLLKPIRWCGRSKC